MRRNTFPKPLADQIYCHLHFHVTPRVVGHWRRLAQALSRHPERFRFYHPDYDQFDLHMEDKVMAFLERIGYDPALTDADHVQRAECLLWQFWKDNVHLCRWHGRVTPLSLEQQMETHGDTVLQDALDMQGRPGENGGVWQDNHWKAWLFHALRKEGWPEYKVNVTVMQVFEEWDYTALSEYLEREWQVAAKPITIRKWVSRALEKVRMRLLREGREHNPGSPSGPASQNIPPCHSYNMREENNVAAENTLSSGGRCAARSVPTRPGAAGARPRLDRSDRPGLFQRGP